MHPRELSVASPKRSSWTGTAQSCQDIRYAISPVVLHSIASRCESISHKIVLQISKIGAGPFDFGVWGAEPPF